MSHLNKLVQSEVLSMDDAALVADDMIITAKATTTVRKMGKLTYVVISKPSDTAKDSMRQKIEKLIIREIKRGDF